MFLLNCLQMLKERMWLFEITIVFETDSIFDLKLMLNIYFFFLVYNQDKQQKYFKYAAQKYGKSH